MKFKKNSHTKSIRIKFNKKINERSIEEDYFFIEFIAYFYIKSKILKKYISIKLQQIIIQQL